MFADYILNGKGVGDVAHGLEQVRFDVNLLRPFFDEKGRDCVTINTGKVKINEKTGELEPVYVKMLRAHAVHNGLMPVINAQTTLRKDQWLEMDRRVLTATRQRLRAYSDIPKFGGFDGMSKSVLESERMTDSGEAMVDMDGLSEGNRDAPKFQLEGIPLPITHSSFTFSSRKMNISRKSGTPLDTTMAEQCGRRVAESIEKTLIGINEGLLYGDQTTRGYDNAPKVYGYTNHPDRITKTDITTPTGVDTADTTVSEVLTMMDLAFAQSFYGPFMLYHSTDWTKWMNTDYITGTASAGLAAPTGTLRQRIMQIDGITDVRRLDFLTDTYTLLLVQMTSDVVRGINGLGVTTVQWETHGGMQLNFKVMAIQVPQIRSQFIRQDSTNAAAKCGIVHATTA